MVYRPCPRCLSIRFGACRTCQARHRVARSCSICRGVTVGARRGPTMTPTELGMPERKVVPLKPGVVLKRAA